MKKGEVFLSGMIFAAVVFKSYNMPGSILLLCVLFYTLSFLYLFFSFAMMNNVPFKAIVFPAAYHNVKFQDIIISVLAGITLAFLLIAVLFKMMFWQGGAFMLTAALIAVFITSFISIICMAAFKTQVYQRILWRTLGWGSVGVILYILPPDRLMKWLNIPFEQMFTPL